MDHTSDNSWQTASYDAIVIGAGIGGLVCATKLALKGMKVLVLERNEFVGGRCGGYKKMGYTVDYSVHGFAYGKTGPLNSIITEAQLILKDKCPIIHWNHVALTVKYRDGSLNLFLPLDARHFWNYFRNGISLSKLKSLSLKEKITFMKIAVAIKTMSPARIREYRTKTVKEMLNDFTESYQLHQFFASSADCVSVIPYDQFVAEDYLEIFQRILRAGGISYPNGGCAIIPESYTEIINLLGSKVITGQNVQQILIEKTSKNGKTNAIGVRLKNGIEIHASCIIANVHQQELFKELIPASQISVFELQKINSIQTSYSAVVIHVGLKTKLIKEEFIMESPVLQNAHPTTASKDSESEKKQRKSIDTEDLIGGMFPIVSNIDPTLAPSGKQLVLAGMAVHNSRMNDKSFLVTKLIEKLQRLIPPNLKLNDYIEWVDVFGQEDITRLFGEQGSIVGCAQKHGQVRENRCDQKFSIQGLYQCGDDSGVGLVGVGTELAAQSGIVCAESVLNDRKKR